MTHGDLRERSEWRAFVDSLGVPCEFLHRDQLRERFPRVSVALSAVFRLVDGAPRLCLDAAALTACADLKALMDLIRGSCLRAEAAS